MPAPIGVKSLKYSRPRSKRSVPCWLLCCAVLLYMVVILGFTAFVMAVFEFGGVTPVLRVMLDWTVVPAVGTVVGPAASCAATLGSAVSYVVNTTLSLANYTDDDDLVRQAVGGVLVGTGALDVAEGVSALQRAGGEGSAAPARPTPVVLGMTVAGGKLWPPFRPAVRRYQVHLDERLADKCGAEGCPGGAPGIEVEMSLTRAGTVRVDREVVQNASGTLRSRVPLEQLFRAGEPPQGHQTVIVQVTDPGASKQSTDFYVLNVVPSPETKRQIAVARRMTSERLVAYEDPQARQEQQLPTVQDQVSLVRETSADADGADAGADANGAIDEDKEVILDQGDYRVFVASKGGFCERVRGIFETGLKEMNIWSAEQDHLVCFPSQRGGDVRLQAKVDPPLHYSERGEFGFGEGVSMGRRPNIETDAIYAMESGVTQLVKLTTPVMLMGLRAQQEGRTTLDLPLVLASPRQREWAVELNFMDPRKGNCEPDASNPGLRRFVCRANRPDVKVRLVVFCDICSPKAGKGGRTLDIQETDNGNSLENGTRRLLESGSAVPWAGWTTNAPSKRGHSLWTITVGEGPEGSEEESSVEYQVGLVVGPTRMPWDVSNLPPRQFEGLGKNLSMLGLVSAAMYLMVMSMQAFGLPAPTLAALPAFSAAVASMQLVAIMGRQIPEPPARLESFAKELLPVEMVSTVAYAFLAVVAFHALAVFRHVVRNGSGSAESLPHGLWMGAWELRAFNVLILPLAYKGATLALVFWVPDYSARPGLIIANVAETALGCIMLLGLLAVPAYVVLVIRGWFFTEQVFGMEMPGSSRVVFVDRTCDQLRAIPMNVSQVATYGRFGRQNQVAEGANSSKLQLAFWKSIRLAASLPSSILGFLASLPGWSFSPTTATISEVEHRGSPGRGSAGKRAGSWSLVWEAGPWGKAGSTSKQESLDDDLSKLPSERVERERADKNQELARKSSQKQLLMSGEGLKAGLVRAETDIGVWHGQPLSRKYIEGGGGAEIEQEKRPKFTPVMYAHPIRATTKFVYLRGGCNGRLAGVAGLPWIDCAVPTKALEELEDEVGRVELRVHPGQLSGPLTSGRLGACFDWTDRVVWRWPVEVVGKILLAFYLAALPYISQALPLPDSAPNFSCTWSSCPAVWTVLQPVLWAVLQPVVILGLLVLGVGTIRNGPHASFVDNFALASWMLVACAGIFMYIGGISVKFAASAAAMSMLCFTAVPVVVFCLTSFFLLALSVISACSDLRRQVVPAVVQNWILEGESLAPAAKNERSGARVAASGYSRLDPSAQAGSHEDRGQLGESSFPDCKIFDPKAAPLGPLTGQLPSRSKRTVTHHLLRVPDAPGARLQQEQSVRGTVPMEANRLFAQRSVGMLVRQPFGALITSKKGLLLFGQAHLNEGGLNWDALIKKVLGRTAAAETAIRLLEEASETPSSSSEVRAPLIVVEVEGEVRPDAGRGRA